MQYATSAKAGSDDLEVSRLRDALVGLIGVVDHGVDWGREMLTGRPRRGDRKRMRDLLDIFERAAADARGELEKAAGERPIGARGAGRS